MFDGCDDSGNRNVRVVIIAKIVNHQTVLRIYDITCYPIPHPVPVLMENDDIFLYIFYASWCIKSLLENGKAHTKNT